MVLFLDSFHLGDPLFATALARDVKARGTGLVLVHGSAEAGERALEASGVWPEAEGGVWRVADAAQAAAVERAARELNRRLVAEINEAGAAVVGLMGAGRGLLRADGDGVAAGRTAWLQTLVAQRGVAVVASLVEAPAARAGTPGGALREVDPAAAAAALAGALGTFVGLLTTSRADSLPDADGAPADALSLPEALATGRLPDARSAEQATGLGVPVRALALPAVRVSGPPPGTWIGAARPPGDGVGRG